MRSLPLSAALTRWRSYELRRECQPAGAPQRHASAAPDALLFFADRLLAVDHASGDAFALALLPRSGAGAAETEAWLAEAAARVAAVAAAPPAPPAWGEAAREAAPAALAARREREAYCADVRACLEAIAAGETYEVCLTTRLSRAQGALQPASLYRLLRECNPAPYAAWLSGGVGADAIAICCSSPERLLRLDRHGVLEAKPIKGTARRVPPLGCAEDVASGAALQASAKERAENLMIVDLLRHDLAHVCLPGSVRVDALCALESYSSVHQLVSTIRGQLRPGLGPVAALRACFPAGSMTGAPKLRTCAIIDGLEAAARGPYSGALGFLSVGGAADLNVIIRTAVVHGGTISVGAGGAVTTLSEPEAEYEVRHRP